MIPAGRFDRKISILRAGPAIDDGHTDTPGTVGIYATRKASWKAANGRETFENLGREAKAGGTFWLRSDTKTRHIVETDQIAFDGRLWDVLGVSEVGARRKGIEVTVAAADGQSEIDLTGLSPLPDANTAYTGWVSYIHTGPDQLVEADVETVLVNDAGSVIETQKPSDIPTFYDGTVITGRNGDTLVVGVELTYVPADGLSSALSLAIDIGGTIGRIYPKDFPITKGADVPHKVYYLTAPYTLGTWQANGGRVKLTSDGAGTVTDVRYVIHRLHKAR